MIFSYTSPFELAANPWNSNKVDRESFNKLKKSMEHYGAFKPIVVRTLPDMKTLEILGGYHRNEAAKELGWKEVPIFDLGMIDDSRAKEIALIDNTRYGSDDEALLEKLLSEITDLDNLAAIMPESVEIDLPEVEDSIEEMEETIREEKPEETHKVLKYKLELDKAEDVEAILARIAYDNDFKHKDGYANYAEALHYAITNLLERR